MPPTQVSVPSPTRFLFLIHGTIKHLALHLDPMLPHFEGIYPRTIVESLKT